MSRVPLIAREGLIPTLIPAVCSIVLLSAGIKGFSLLLAVLAVGIALFFRDPVRIVNIRDNDIVSPADGRIVAVDRREEKKHLGGDSLRISVFMSIFNVHINRIPADGRVVEVNHIPGGFKMAHLEEAGLENERSEVVLEDEKGRRSLIVQVAGLVARRIICHLSPGDQVKAGERFGLICFGSRVDVYLPPETEPRVSVGDRVKAGISVIGALD
ncbi:MAG: phosphatidylserine decarboxylase family protein [bacterium]